MVSQIKALRRRAKLSQVELARLVGVDVATVRRWETGPTVPRLPQLHRLAGVLRVTVDELGFGSSE